MKPQHHIIDRLDVALMSIAADRAHPIEIRLNDTDQTALRHYLQSITGTTTPGHAELYKDVPVTGETGESHIVARNSAGTASDRVHI